MNTLVLTRFAYLEDCTFGHLILPTGAHLYTIECPWLDNEPFVSCIPEGIYPLEYDATGRTQNVPRLRDTQPRTQINIHVANWAHQLHGCIAPGLGYDLGERKVTQSTKAMSLLMEALPAIETLKRRSVGIMDGDDLSAQLIISSARAE